MPTATGSFVKKDGKNVPADTYKTEVDDKGNAKKGDDGNPIFVKDKDGKYISDPKGREPAFRSARSGRGSAVSPRRKGYLRRR